MAGRHETTRTARTVELIETISIRGEGIDSTDPIREVFQYWTKDGELLAENDSCSLEKLRGQPMEHKYRHQFLHQMLDELVADAIVHYPTLLSSVKRGKEGFRSSTHTVSDLMNWSRKQAHDPDHPPTK
jgi:hypothetical protein